MTRAKASAILFVAFTLLGATSAGFANTDAGYSYYEVGKVNSARPAPTERALLLVGGGDWHLDAFRWFAAKTGHGHLVVILLMATVRTELFHRDSAASLRSRRSSSPAARRSYNPRVLAFCVTRTASSSPVATRRNTSASGKARR